MARAADPGAEELDGLQKSIVARLREAGANITDLTTRLSGDLYVLLAEVALPPGADPEQLRARLDAASAELGVEVTLRPVENDEL